MRISSDNLPLPKVGECHLCETQGPIRQYLCIDCLFKSRNQRNIAFSNILDILEDDDLTVFENFELPTRLDGRRVIEIDSIKSTQELIRLYWHHRNKNMDFSDLYRNTEKQLSRLS
ncbi:hypothetical protein LCGC14_3089920, partial [marine sediment metagenome]